MPESTFVELTPDPQKLSDLAAMHSGISSL